MVLGKVTDDKDDKPCPCSATANLESMKKVKEPLEKLRMLVHISNIKGDDPKVDGKLVKCIVDAAAGIASFDTHKDLYDIVKKHDEYDPISRAEIDCIIEKYNDSINVDSSRSCLTYCVRCNSLPLRAITIVVISLYWYFVPPQLHKQPNSHKNT